MVVRAGDLRQRREGARPRGFRHRRRRTDTAVGLDGNHADIAMLQTPDGHGRLELFEYLRPEASESEPTRPREIGMHRVAFSVDDIDAALATAAQHGCHPLRGVRPIGPTNPALSRGGLSGHRRRRFPEEEALTRGRG
ncbi:hypothetical protein DQ392_31145 [Streptomyces reniochalinae]|uniref:VOC domain-containing protein n=1 Tax=Streptomyces reniochalinae TaxID=2250578 RepID=A0A367E6Y8_9ACTN|nr:hypothetical protein DQ392_31145 [Streptomyces reniochalinae]